MKRPEFEPEYIEEGIDIRPIIAFVIVVLAFLICI
jgi:hypothetical protein